MKMVTVITAALALLLAAVVAEEQAFQYTLDGSGASQCFIEYIQSGQEGYAKIDSESTNLVLKIINSE